MARRKIDDYEPFSALIAEALNQVGYTVRTVDTPEHVYAALECRTPDLILCEQRVKGVSGFDLITVLRRHGMATGVPLVLMGTDLSCFEVGTLQGIGGYLAKPFELDDLYACVETCCQTKTKPLQERSVSAPV